MVFTKKFGWGALGILIILLTFLGISNFDYTFSKALINPEAGWAIVLKAFGEFPAYFGILLSVVILTGSRNREKKVWKWLMWGVGSLFMLLFAMMVSMLPIHYFYEDAADGIPSGMMMVVYLETCIWFVLGQVLMAKVPRAQFKRLIRPAWTLIFIVIAETLIVNVLKIIWARPRMRTLTSIEGFKYWYQINGPTSVDDMKSFPSGHTANAFAILAYTLFVPYFKGINKKAVITVGVLWGIIVALSRVVLGAHFLSDVIVGGYITMILLIFGSRWIVTE